MEKNLRLVIIICSLLFCNLAISATKTSKSSIILPQKLRVGDTVGLIAPAFRVAEDINIEYAKERLEALGLKVKIGKSVYKRFGYFAGTDQERARDINEMFADPEVKAIIAVRGGWGCNRILNLLNYKLIKENPKIIMGYSDITSLLLAINKKTGVVTFHGPMGVSQWSAFTTNHVKDVLFYAKKVSFANPVREDDDLIQTKDRIITIKGGQATGRLFGGSLSLLATLVGSQYLPKFDGAILFVEDVDENIYALDRLLWQLKEAKILNRIAGFVFGKCTECGIKCNSTTSSYGSLTLQQVIDQYIKPLNIPAWYGSMIGHEKDIFTLPEGVVVTIDADKGTIEMQEPAVK